MGLKQHVNVPTHVSGHMLDLMITRKHDPVISGVPVADRDLSDHASILHSLNSAKPDRVAKIICYRQLRATDFNALRQDVEKSELCTREYNVQLQFDANISSGQACADEGESGCL